MYKSHCNHSIKHRTCSCGVSQHEERPPQLHSGISRAAQAPPAEPPSEAASWSITPAPWQQPSEVCKSAIQREGRWKWKLFTPKTLARFQAHHWLNSQQLSSGQSHSQPKSSIFSCHLKAWWPLLTSPTPAHCRGHQYFLM